MELYPRFDPATTSDRAGNVASAATSASLGSSVTRGGQRRHIAASAWVLAAWTLAVTSSSALAANGTRTNTELEEVLVTAALQQADARRASITLLDQKAINDRSAQHIEDLLSAAPNVNTSSGASRGRFFQIRGIGERSQFVEPVNASVALMLDGIDLTGLGGVATTWDLEQVEILRGPQGTLLGANALAGLINLRSTAPDAGDELRLSAGLETYGGYRTGAVLGGALTETWSGRIALQQYRSDGFIKNDWLQRDDTNNLDEFTGRAGLTYVDGDSRWDIGLYRIDVDNGYDAFSLDNTRHTLSDQPGRDTTETTAGRVRWQHTGDITLSAQLSAADTQAVYSYDEDWSYEGIAPGWEYSSFDEYRRDRSMESLELRASNGDNGRQDYPAALTWVVGTYLRTEEESLNRNYTYLAAPFNSELSIDTGAVFGQVDIPVGAQINTFFGARLEQRNADYADNNGVADTIDSTLWSGRVGIEWQINEQSGVYASVSRGVRSGGFNANLLASLEALPPTDSTPLAPLGTFDEESLISVEVGWRWTSASGAASSELTVFSMSRRDQQVKRSLTIPRSDGSTAFIDYTDNAAEGSNDGLEWQGHWQVTSNLHLSGSLGILDATYDNYTTALGEDLSGRDQPQAPSLMGNLALDWQVYSALSLGIEMTTMDNYYFSDRHDTLSPSRQLWNTHIRWEQGNWQVQLWGRNLTDEDYFVRGFGSFGNDPRKEYVTEPYYQFGEPRIVGLTVSYKR